MSVERPAVIRFTGLSIAAQDPARLASFWAAVLDGSAHEGSGGWVVNPPEADGYALRFYPLEIPKRGQNRIHLDLTSESADTMAATIGRATAAGGELIDVGQTKEEGHQVRRTGSGSDSFSARRTWTGRGPIWWRSEPPRPSTRS